MPIDPSISMGVRPLEVPNPLNQLAQVSQIQASQRQGEVAQMQLEDLKNDRIEMQKLQQDIIAKGGNPDLRSLAATLLKSPKHFMQGVELTQKLAEQDKFETIGRKLYPELFGAAPGAAAAPAAPAAAPTVPMQPGALGSGTFGMMPEPAVAPRAAAPMPTNAMAPAQPAAPVANALVATEKTPDELRRDIMLFGQSTAPGAKNFVDMLKSQLTEALKATTVSPGQQVYRGGKVVYERAPTPSEFERLLDASNLTDAEKISLRRQRALKEATHAPGTTVNVSTEKAYGGAFGSKLADVDINKMTTAEKAPALADSANRIIGLVQQGNVFTGPAADIKLNIARVLNVAGANNQEKIANTEALIAATGQSTLDAIKGAGLGTGQGFTDKDLNFLRGIAGGTINLTQQTLTELATLQHRVAERSAAAWNKRVGELPKSVVEGTGLSTAPITIPALAFPNIKKQPSVVQTPAPAGLDPALWSVMTPQERALWQK